MPHLDRLLCEMTVTAHWVCWRHTHDLTVKLLYSYQFSPQSTYLNSLNSFFLMLVVFFWPSYGLFVQSAFEEAAWWR